MATRWSFGSFVRRIFRALGASGGSTVIPVGPSHSLLFSARSTGAIFQAYRKTPWFYASNNLLAHERATSLRRHLELYDGPEDDKQRKLVERGDRRYEVLNVLRRPVRVSTGELLTPRMRNKALALWLGLSGEAYIAKIRSLLTGLPVALVPVSPLWVLQKPTVNRKKYLVQLAANGTPQEFDARDIIPLIDPVAENPFGPGLGAGSTLDDEIDTDEGAGQMGRAVLQNMGMPSGLLVLEGIEPGEEKSVRKDWNERFQGPAKAGQVEFARGKANWIPLTSNIKDAQLIDLRKHLRDTFIQIAGVSPEVFGILDGSTRESAYVARYHMALNAIVPWLDIFTDALQAHLVPEFGSEEDLFLDYSSPVPEDTELKLRCVGTAPKAFKGRDVRSIGAFPPDEDLDDVVLGDEAQRTTPTQMPQSPAGGRALARDPEFVRELARNPVFNRALARRATEPVG